MFHVLHQLNPEKSEESVIFISKNDVVFIKGSKGGKRYAMQQDSNTLTVTVAWQVYFFRILFSYYGLWKAGHKSQSVLFAFAVQYMFSTVGQLVLTAKLSPNR